MTQRRLNTRTVTESLSVTSVFASETPASFSFCDVPLERNVCSSAVDIPFFVISSEFSIFNVFSVSDFGRVRFEPDSPV